MAPTNQAWGGGLCLLLIPAMLIGPLQPRRWTVYVSALAALAWLFFGVIGDGVDC